MKQQQPIYRDNEGNMTRCKYCNAIIGYDGRDYRIQGNFGGYIEAFHLDCEKANNVQDVVSLMCMKAATCPHKDRECKL